MSRHTQVKKFNRIVLKVGSRLVIGQGGQEAKDRIRALVAEIASLRRAGKEVILVSSGAISTGMAMLGWKKRPTALPDLQAAAATGQCQLMAMYEEACRAEGFHCAQLLLTHEDVRVWKRHLNVTNCLNALLERNILPIINENDSVAIEEICFGENDNLAALVGILARADCTVLLSSINGFLLRQPDGTLGERVPLIDEITPEYWAMASGTDGNQFSTGGMATKLKAAQRLMKVGSSMIIADGSDFSAISRLFKGDDLGTLFTGASRLKGSKRFMAFFPETKGSLVVDAGAAQALISKGRSLLPGGILFVEGSFQKGEVVDIADGSGRAIGRGAVNYSSADILRIKGRKSIELAAIIGQEFYEEVIHRDNMVIMEEN